MPGSYWPDAEDPAEADALAEPLWELALAASHYHPHVASSSQSIASIPPEGKLLSLVIYSCSCPKAVQWLPVQHFSMPLSCVRHAGNPCRGSRVF